MKSLDVLDAGVYPLVVGVHLVEESSVLHQNPAHAPAQGLLVHTWGTRTGTNSDCWCTHDAPYRRSSSDNWCTHKARYTRTAQTIGAHMKHPALHQLRSLVHTWGTLHHISSDYWCAHETSEALFWPQARLQVTVQSWWAKVSCRKYMWTR